MSNLKIFSEDLKVSNKRIIVRLDLNVPINNFKIEDNTRIKIIEPLIQYHFLSSYLFGLIPSISWKKSIMRILIFLMIDLLTKTGDINYRNLSRKR